LPTRVAVGYSRMEGGNTSKFREDGCASKQRLLNVKKLNKGGKREFY